MSDQNIRLSSETTQLAPRNSNLFFYKTFENHLKSFDFYLSKCRNWN